MISDFDRNKALNAVIATQCFGLVAWLCFGNGLIFNYLTYLDVSEQSLVIYLRIPSILALFTTLPLAYIADKKGKLKMGQWGNVVQVIGMSCLCAAAYVSGNKVIFILGGIFLFSFGSSMVNSSWFALLDPIVKPEMRGDFFAKLRTSWQIFGVIFTFAAQFILELKGDSIISPILMFVVLLIVVRMYFYSKIPELEASDLGNKNFKTSFRQELKNLFSHSLFMRYCIFIFIMPLFIGSITLIFNLYEQSVLNFSSADIVLMGNLVMIGSILGFAMGAYMLKKLGEKLLFFLCSCCISVCSVLFILHEYFTFIPIKYYIGFLTLCTGLSMSAMSIGITSLMLHLLPQDNKSFSTSFFLSAQELGTGVSAVLLSLSISFFGEKNQSFMSVNINVYTVTLLTVAALFPIGVLIFNRSVKNVNS